MPADKQHELNDSFRLEQLRRSELLDGATSPLLDRLTRIASALLGVPVSLVSLVDNAGQHFPGLTGLTGWAAERRGTALSHSFCQHVVTSNSPLIIEDAHASAVVADNLAVPRLGVIAYAGVPLRTADGHVLGALCAIDAAPKKWTPQEVAILEDLAALAIAEIEARVQQGARDHSHDGPPVTCDALTGLLNNRGLLEYGTTGANEASDRQPFSIVSVDIDGFGAFNNMFGYEQGNARLRELGELLVNVAHETDVVARAGVDEFVVVLSGADQAHADGFVARVRQALEIRNALHATPDLTLSVGAATYSASAPLPFARLLHHAEAEMYRAMGARLRSLQPVVGER